MNKNIKFLLAGFFLLHILFSSCLNDNTSKISEGDLRILKQKYSAEVINYFYETAFHEDSKTEKQNNLIKWQRNPTVILRGNPTNIDTAYVKKAIDILNNLNLSLKYNLDFDSKEGDLIIYFGDRKYITSIFHADTSAMGICIADATRGTINKIKIGIPHKDADTTIHNFERIVLEEILQSTGIVGDSYTYPNSLFFEEFNPNKNLIKIDKEIIQLLYEPKIPVNYSRLDFENDFADVLYSVKTNEKISGYLLKNKIDKGVLDSIETYFMKGVFYKHPKTINVYLKGDYKLDDSILVQNIIVSLNKISPNINLGLKANPQIAPHVGIFLDFKKVEKQDSFIVVTDKMYRGYATMFPKRLKNEVTISFNEDKENLITKQKSIVEALHNCLGLSPKNEQDFKDFYTKKGNNIVLKQIYVDILKTMYSDEFIDGYKIRKLEGLKSKLK